VSSPRGPGVSQCQVSDDEINAETALESLPCVEETVGEHDDRIDIVAETACTGNSALIFIHVLT